MSRHETVPWCAGATQRRQSSIAPREGDTKVEIKTSNPSQDDNLFLVVIKITAVATVTTEVCNDGLDNDGDGKIDAADPDCVPVNKGPTAEANGPYAVDEAPRCSSAAPARPTRMRATR